MDEFKYGGLVVEGKMQFQIDKWFGTASAVMWMLPVSCGDERQSSKYMSQSML